MNLIAHIGIDQEPRQRAAPFGLWQPRITEAIENALQDLELETPSGTVAARSVFVRLEDA